jgi:hypothetical protein
MAQRPRFKTALFAAASLTAVGGMAGHAALAEPHPASAIVLSTHQVAADEERAPLPPTAKTVGLAALAAAAFGFALQFLGAERVARLAKAAVAAPAAAARAIGSAIGEPVRFVLAITLLAALGFAGLGLFNLEWAGGLAVGAGFVALIWAGATRFRAALASRRARQ